MQSVTLNTSQGRENHQRTMRHYSRSGEPPVALIDADGDLDSAVDVAANDLALADGTMRQIWRETCHRDAKNHEESREKNHKANGRINLDGSGDYDDFGVYIWYMRATSNGLLCSQTIETINQN